MCLVLVVKVAILVTIISFSLLGCANEYDLDDLEKLKKVASTAILESALTESEDFMSTFSGWAKRKYSNGQLESLTLYKDGKWDGPCVFWFENGLKMHQGNYLKGREHGDGDFGEWMVPIPKSKHLIMERRTVPMFGGIQMEKRSGGTFKRGARDGLWIFTTSKASRINSFHTIWELSYFRLIE